ncbi:MAG: hypothetical protein K2L52_02320 [Clostridia bacterium]|nr:hypothetical protein [Clostridia bacterium]
MFNSQIIRVFLDSAREGERFKVDKCKFEKEIEVALKLEDALIKKFNGDKELIDLYYDLDKANYDLHYAELKETFRQAFIIEAQVALRICGVEGESD